MRFIGGVNAKGGNMYREWHSAESVTEGHPDKLCDQIVDRILDATIEQDRFGRVEVNALATAGLVLLSGQMSTKSYVDITGIVRETVRDVGYTEIETGFDYASIAVLSIIEEQSPELALAVDQRGA
ncbi:MAG TPA: methionine adenosyltransferase, partial [Proteobacteria bacterium]|nr:methionine adenosyltransferase [Pseudomonadota bacterium]